MAISVFPAGGGGEFITNDFVVDMNDTDNNVIDLGRSYAQGSYDITLASGDTSFDIYALDTDGASVGYTNNATLITTDAFTSLVILGVANDEKITFSFSGASNNATSEGDAPGAGAYLESANPTDLPNQDDTTTVTGGNFASDVQVFFESGQTSTLAKNITRNDSTELIVTRPDALDPELDPWSLRAKNPGVQEPTGSDIHILQDVIDAGATPVWVTTSPLPQGTTSSAYSETVVATDADGDVSYSVTAGSLPAGLSLNGTTGVISGTPTAGGETFTLQALDEGGNSNEREFTIPIQKATGGVVSTAGNYIVHTFDSSDDFIALADISSLEYLVVAGGAAAGGRERFDAGGAGGAGGLRSSISGESSGGGGALETPLNISAGTYTVSVGAGGQGVDQAAGGDGGDSAFSNLVSTTGGGGGGYTDGGRPGGSGGGASISSTTHTGGNGIAGEGFDGGDSLNNELGGGGGAGGAGNSGRGGGGAPLTSSATGVAIDYAEGGDGSGYNDNQATGLPNNTPGGGGQAQTKSDFSNGPGEDGNGGIVIVRYE